MLSLSLYPKVITVSFHFNFDHKTVQLLTDKTNVWLTSVYVIVRLGQVSLVQTVSSFNVCYEFWIVQLALICFVID